MVKRIYNLLFFSACSAQFFMDQHSCWCFTSEKMNNKKKILYNNFDPPPNLAISVSMCRSASRRRLIF